MTRHLSVLCVLLALPGCGAGALIGGVVATSGSSGHSSSRSYVPAVALRAVTPAEDTVRGGSRVTISGQNFSTGQRPVVTFDGLAGEDLEVLDSEHLQVTVPSHEHIATPGPVDLTLVDPAGGTATLADGFRYLDGAPQATVSVSGNVQSGNVVITLTLSDPESELVDVELELSAGDGWEPLQASELVGGLSGLTTSPEGLVHHLTWDSRPRFPAANADGVVLRATPVDRGHLEPSAGAPSESAPFRIANDESACLYVTQPADDAYAVALSYRVSDADAEDTLMLTDVTWTDQHRGTSGPATLLRGEPGAVPGSVSSSAGGEDHLLVWDSFADLGYGNDRLVRLSLTISDGDAQVTEVTEPFFVHNGPLDHGRSYALTGDVASDPRGLAVGDFNGNGDLDLVVSGGRTLAARWGTGTAFSPTFTRGLVGAPQALDEDLRWDGSLNVVRQGGADTSLRAGDWIGLPTAGDPIGPRFFRVASVSGDTAVLSDPWGYQPAGLMPGASGLGGPVSGSGATLRAAGEAAGGEGLAPDLRPGALVALAVDEDLTAPGPVTQDLVVLNHVQPLRETTLAAGVAAGETRLLVANAAPDQRALEAGRLLWIGAPGGAGEQAQVASVDLETSAVHLAQGLGQPWPAATPVTVLDSSAAFLAAGQQANHSFCVVPGSYAGLGQASESISSGGLFPQHAVAADVLGSDHGGPDGVDDLVVVNAVSPADPTRGRVSVFMRRPSGGFADPVLLDVGRGAGAASAYACVADVTSDGLPDIAVANPGEASVSLLVQGPAGSFDEHVIDLSGWGLPAGDVESVALADLDLDGRLDLAVLGSLSQRIYLLRGADPDGPGGLVSLPGGDPAEPCLTVTQTPAPPAVVAGSPSTQPCTSLYTDLQPTQLTVGDLNEDGRPDLVVAGTGSNDVTLFLNLGGQGSLAFGVVRSTTGLQPVRATIADISGDGRDDVVVLDGFTNDVHVFLQTTPGTLDQYQAVPVGEDPLALVLGNLSRDRPGAQVVVANSGDHSLSVLSWAGGRGMTSITPGGVPLSLQWQPSARVQPTPSVDEVQTLVPLQPALGDLDGDGRDDLAVSMQVLAPSSPLSGAVDVLLNRDGATPLQGTDLVLQAQPQTLTVAVGDLVGDAALDLAVTNLSGPYGLPGSGTLQVFAGDGRGAFTPAAEFAVTSPVDVRLVDLDGDGDLDVLVAGRDASGSNFQVLVQEPRGTLQPPVDGVPGGIPASISSTATSFLAPGDFNADGLLDVAFLDFTDGRCGVAFQAAPATEPPSFPTVVSLSCRGRGLLAAGDLNGDGRVDLAMTVIDQDLVALHLQRPGSAKAATESLEAPFYLATGPSPYGLTIGDVDADGRQDLLVTSRGSNSLNVFFQR